MSIASRLGGMFVATLLGACHVAGTEDGHAAASPSGDSQPGDVPLDGEAPADSMHARVLALADSGWHPDLDLEQATSVLTGARYFSTARTGRSAQPDPQAVAFVRVLVDESAPTRFAALAADRNDCARLYGVCGLYLLDRAAFDEVISREATSSGKVMFWQGCFGTRTEVSEVLDAPFGANLDVSRGGLPLGFVRLAETLSHEPRTPR